MLGKVDKTTQEEGGEIQILVSDDGGTTWYPAKCDDEGRIVVKNTNAAGTVINPATEGKQDDIISKLPGTLVTSAYDYIALTYVAAGDGVGEIETVTYKTGGSSGTTVATLTLAYNASNEISSITKS